MATRRRGIGEAAEFLRQPWRLTCSLLQWYREKGRHVRERRNDKGRRERDGALDLLARGEVRGGRGVLLVLLPIADGDGWLDPLGVEVSASVGGCGRRGWGDGSLLGCRIRDLVV